VLVVPLGRQRAVGLYRSPTTGMFVLTWRGGRAEDVRRLLEMFDHTDCFIAAYGKR